MLKKIQFLSAVILAALVFAACTSGPQSAGANAARTLRVGLPTSWSAFTPLPFDETYADQVNALAADSTYLLAVGFDSEGAETFADCYSPSSGWTNLTNLTTSTSVGFTGKPSSAHYLNGAFLVTSGKGGIAAYSTDEGANWHGTSVGFGTKAGVYGSSDGKYVVAGQDGQAAYASNLASGFTTISSTYTGWTTGADPDRYINTGDYGHVNYVFGGGSGRIAWTDTILIPGTNTPKTWTRAEGVTEFGSNGFVNVIVYGGGNFVAVGNNYGGTGIIMYSDDDGKTWKTADTGEAASIASAPVYALAYGDDCFTAVNDDGHAAYSEDFGATWFSSEDTPFGINPYVNYAAYYPTTNTFFAGGDNRNGMVLVESD
jgi:hypothetical protein